MSRTEETALAKTNAELALYNQATNVAGLCKDIVIKTAVTIGTRKFVPVEAWTTIAVAHGCIASVKEGTVGEVFSADGKFLGIRAVGEVRRQSDGAVLTSAEGFVGYDEVDWYGSHGVEIMRWNKFKKREEPKVVEKRPDYAIRAMAQTRSVSRACRTAFSHCVVLMNAGLSTTPAEEVANPDDGGEDAPIHVDQTERRQADGTASEPREQNVTGSAATPQNKKPAPEVPRDVDPKLKEQFRDNKWEGVKIHFGKNAGKALSELDSPALKWYVDDWQPKPFGNKPISEDDKLLRAALDVAGEEAFSK